MDSSNSSNSALTAAQSSSTSSSVAIPPPPYSFHSKAARAANRTSFVRHPWFSKDQLLWPPSVRQGFTLHTEREHRRLGCRVIKQLGEYLALSQHIIARAYVYFHIFYTRNTFQEFQSEVMGITCLFLAGKVSDSRLQCEKVIFSYHKIFGLETPSGEKIESTRQQIFEYERILLDCIEYNFDVELPYAKLKGGMETVYPFLAQYPKTKDGKNVPTWDDLKLYSWTYLNESVPTILCLYYPPIAIMTAGLYFAIDYCALDQPRLRYSDGSEAYWYTHFYGISQETMHDMITELSAAIARSKSEGGSARASVSSTQSALGHPSSAPTLPPRHAPTPPRASRSHTPMRGPRRKGAFPTEVLSSSAAPPVAPVPEEVASASGPSVTVKEERQSEHQQIPAKRNGSSQPSVWAVGPEDTKSSSASTNGRASQKPVKKEERKPCPRCHRQLTKREYEEHREECKRHFQEEQDRKKRARLANNAPSSSVAPDAGVNAGAGASAPPSAPPNAAPADDSSSSLPPSEQPSTELEPPLKRQRQTTPSEAELSPHLQAPNGVNGTETPPDVELSPRLQEKGQRERGSGKRHRNRDRSSRPSVKLESLALSQSQAHPSSSSARQSSSKRQKNSPAIAADLPPLEPQPDNLDSEFDPPSPTNHGFSKQIGAALPSPALNGTDNEHAGAVLADEQCDRAHGLNGFALAYPRLTITTSPNGHG